MHWRSVGLREASAEYPKATGNFDPMSLPLSFAPMMTTMQGKRRHPDGMVWNNQMRTVTMILNMHLCCAVEGTKMGEAEWRGTADTEPDPQDQTAAHPRDAYAPKALMNTPARIECGYRPANERADAPRPQQTIGAQTRQNRSVAADCVDLPRSRYCPTPRQNARNSGPYDHDWCAATTHQQRPWSKADHWWKGQMSAEAEAAVYATEQGDVATASEGTSEIVGASGVVQVNAQTLVG